MCLLTFVESYSTLGAYAARSRKMNKDNLRKQALGAALAIGTWFLASCTPTEGRPVPGGTELNPMTPTPVLPTETPQPTATFTPTETLEPTPTATATSSEGNLLDFFAQSSDRIKSDYPAWLNRLGIEVNGINVTSVDKIKDYFLQRELKAEMGSQKLDRMFGQLNLPVVDLSDRDLNFDWRNGGQGLGFSDKDFGVLRTYSDMKATQEPSGNGVFDSISRKGEDGRNRAWTISPARDFEKTVLSYVDEFLRLNGIVNPSTNTLIQDQRRNLFEKIVYDELGVKATDPDGLWQTVNDNFQVCETFTANADTRSTQPESLRSVDFNPDLETGTPGPEQDTTSEHDSDNTVLVVMVTDGTTLRVEVYDLSDPVDPLIPQPDLVSPDGEPRDFGGRWLPCGPGTPASFPGQPNIPPPGGPTPAPTNEHRGDTNPGSSDKPDRQSSTQIP